MLPWRVFFPWSPISPAGEIADPDLRPARRPFEIDSIEIDGAARPVIERCALETPFAALTALELRAKAPRAKALLVTPMSGHFGVVLRDLAIALLRGCDVYVLEWRDPRQTPSECGAFGFEGNIDAVVDALRLLGGGVHAVGVCQGAAPTLAASVWLHQRESPDRPATLSLVGGPIDPAAAPTRVSSMLAATPASWLESFALQTVPPGYPGAGRRIYPAQSQWRGLLAHLSRHVYSGGPLLRKVFANDGLDADRFPFLTAFTSVMDIEGRAFVENISAIFHRRLLAVGRLRYGGDLLDPSRIDDLPLMTIAAAQDDVVAPGQTLAAHRLFRSAPEARRRRLLLPKGGHFDLVHGRTCREIVAPAMMRFFADAPRRKGGRRARPTARNSVGG